VRRDAGEQPGRDSARVRRNPPASRRRPPTMNRYLAPLSFTIAAAWVVVLFVLAAKP
jgi:hypothetical protein